MCVHINVKAFGSLLINLSLSLSLSPFVSPSHAEVTTTVLKYVCLLLEGPLQSCAGRRRGKMEDIEGG